MLKLAKTTDEAELRSHFLSLFNVALIDNELAPEEQEYLYDLGASHGISPESMDTILRHENLEDSWAMPESAEQRLAQVFDLVCMMLADNRLDEREVELCVKLARKLGFRENILGGLVKALITAADDNADHEAIRKELDLYLTYPDKI